MSSVEFNMYQSAKHINVEIASELAGNLTVIAEDSNARSVDLTWAYSHNTKYDYYMLDEDVQAISNKLKELNGIYKTVKCKYATSSQLYTFKTKENCKPKDKAVVFTNGSWSVVTIVEIDEVPETSDKYTLAWLVQVVDRSAYDANVIADHDNVPNVSTRL